jgi:Helicase C-terminal domain/DEAD/DEAH box helicase
LATSPDFAERLAAFASGNFTELRPGQKLVLDAYATDHLDTADLAIEMPTGDGKTLLALLIADWALDQGWSVAYLTGTRQLAEHVESEAVRLGLEVVRFAGRNYGGAKLDDYHQANAVGVMNYWVYFNSKPVVQPADLVIFDDAHLAEQPLSSLQTLRIPYTKGASADLYRAICKIAVTRTTGYPGLRAMLDGSAPPGTPPELLSFFDWSAISDDVVKEIDRSEYGQERDVKWVWPKIRERIDRCGVLVGSSAIEIRPYHPPTTVNTGYSRARQRIYLSATLGSMDDLQRRVGGRSITRLTTSKPLPAGATGERKFVLNSSSQEPFEDLVLDWALEQVRSAGGRAAWLCASHAEADELQEILEAVNQSVFRLRPGDDDMVDAWSRAASGHLLTAGRYDGLDLHGDICKLVVITSVPQASSEFERFVVAYLGDASFMRHRVGQRVTQALGRANRTESDRALYLGLDPRFAQILADPAVRASIPAAAAPTVREALELFDDGWQATQRACQRFWAPSGTSFQADRQNAPAEPAPAPRKVRPGRAARGSGEVASAQAEVAAATDLWLGDQKQAAGYAREAARLLRAAGEQEHAAFWRYVEAHALFDRGSQHDVDDARQALQDAVENGPRTAWFLRLKGTIADLSGQEKGAADGDRIFLAWDDLHREYGAHLDQALAETRRQLAGSHDEQCEGLKVLARLAGAAGDRPPRSEQSATDCRWSWSTTRRAERRVWEVKTGKAIEISRSEINQILGQIEVEMTRVARTRIYGCLLTPATRSKLDASEAAAQKITLVHHGAVMALFEMLARRVLDYVGLCGTGSAEERGEARTRLERMLPDDGFLERLLAPSNGRVLGVEDVAEIFPPN